MMGFLLLSKRRPLSHFAPAIKPEKAALLSALLERLE